MTQEESDIAQFKLDRMVRTLEEMRPIIKTFINSMNGITHSGRASLTAFAILERIYYNIISASPLAKDLAFNQNIAIPLSHILRSVIYEVVISYWLMAGDFDKNISRLNKDFVKKNYNRLKEEGYITDNNVLQELFGRWSSIAPDNFVKDDSGSIIINEKVKPITFSDICKSLADDGYNLKHLAAAYAILSQQAHLSEFTRPMIYEKYPNNISLFAFATWSTIHTAIMLIKCIDPSSVSLPLLEKLLLVYPEKQGPQLKSDTQGRG